MKRNLSPIALWLLIALVDISEVTPLWAGDFFVRVTDNRVTLKTDNTPLQQVLRQIEAQSEIKMQFFIEADDVVTAELNDIPLEEGLDTLLQRYNRAISYRSMPNNVLAITNIFLHSRSITTDEPLHLKLSLSRSLVDTQTALRINHTSRPGEIALYNTNPRDNDPLNSMRGIDPLARFEHQPPDHDPQTARPTLLPSPEQLPTLH